MTTPKSKKARNWWSVFGAPLQHLFRHTPPPPTQTGKEMLRIAVVNQKGGVGKTTLSCHLAGALVEMRWRVLLCDCDSQGDLTTVLTPDHDETGRSMADIFAGTTLPMSELIRHTGLEGLDIIPADGRLRLVDKTTGYEEGPEAQYLTDALSEVEGAYDAVVLDCPPRPHLSGYGALCAARQVVVPVEAQLFSIKGMRNLNWELDVVRRRLNPGLKLLGYVLTKVDSRASTQQVYRAMLAEELGQALLFDTMLPTMKGFVTALEHHRPVTVHAKRSKPAQIMRQLALEIIERDNTYHERSQRAA